MNTHLAIVPPRNENRQVGLSRPTNASLRTREYLTPAEIEKLIKTAKEGRYGLRDACLILTSYRHGLRAKEACQLEWSQVEFGRNATLHVRRVKNGKPSVHPIRGDELRMLAALRRAYPVTGFVFNSQHATPFTEDAANRLIKNIGIQDWLGHASIQHTVIYTQLSPSASKTSGGTNSQPGRSVVKGIGPGFLIPKTIPPSLREASKKMDPVFRAIRARKGPFSESFLHYSEVIFYVNFLLFTPCLEDLF